VGAAGLLLAQPSPAGTDGLRRQFREAEALYARATAAEGISPEAEDSLNQKALELFTGLEGKLAGVPGMDTLHLLAMTRTGELQHYFENTARALQQYRKAIGLRTGSRLPDSLFFKPFLYGGILHYHQNAFDTAARYFSIADSIQAQYAGHLPESERLYNMLGVLHYETGNYSLAKKHFQKALEVLLPTHPYYEGLLVNYKINLAQMHFRLDEYEAAHRIYSEIIPFGQNLDEIYHNLGTINLYLGAPEKAIDYFRKVRYTSAKAIRLANNMAHAFLQLETYDSSRAWLQEAFRINRALGAQSDHVAYGQSLKTMGDLLVAEEKREGALPYYQAALGQFYPAFRDTSIAAVPARFTGVFSYINLFHTLVAKGDVLQQLYEKSKARQSGDRAISAYASAFDLAGYVQRTYSSDEARLFLNGIKHTVHARPIDLAYALYRQTGETDYVEQLYIFDQQNKASTLAYNTAAAEGSGGKDAAIRRRADALREEITRLSIRAGKLQDSSRQQQLSRQIRDLEIHLAKLQASLRGQGSIAIPSIADLQRRILDGHTALLSYHLAEKSITTLLVTREKVFCTQQPVGPGFHDAVTRYIVDIQKGNEIPSAVTKALYHTLMDSLPLEDISRLIIIPDDELNYLPFESLRDAQGTWLIEKYSIQYQYATPLLKRQVTHLSGAPVLSLAPFALRGSRDGRFAHLPHSMTEIASLPGRVLVDTAATREALLHWLPQFKILHLATHAQASVKGTQSHIALAPGDSSGLLYEGEIMQLPLDAELVILSACETGSGNLVKGEGIMSLSRAFAYAGCSNIVTSLWKANDFSTSYLSGKMHHYLREGDPVDRAVQKAKQDYLRDAAIHPRLKHPHYWSHLVFIGDLEAEERSGKAWWIAGLVLALGAGAVTLQRKSRR